MLMALGLMLVYVWFRFTNKFGVATVAALLHDVIIAWACSPCCSGTSI